MSILSVSIDTKYVDTPEHWAITTFNILSLNYFKENKT